MKQFITFKSHITPIRLKDVDTDMIIPAQYLKGTGMDGYGEHIFARVKESDASFALNHPQYADSEIILAEANFGCGSSREHAVWALMQAGVKAIIAPSFSDIFFNNSAKNGLLLIQLSPEEVSRLFELAEADMLHLTVDLENQKIAHDELDDIPFEYDPFAKHCLLNGMNQLDYLMSHMTEIDEYDIKRRQHLFVRGIK